MWTPTFGEVLEVYREPSNLHDAHAVSVQRDRNIVGHVPRELSRACHSLLFYSVVANISCEVIGHRIFGKGLEVSCTYKFTGKGAVRKARTTLTRKKK